MPTRNIVLANNQTYHIFSRSVRQMSIFTGVYDCSLFLDVIEYYLQESPPVKFSKYRKQKSKFILSLDINFIVKIIAFCIMPTHFHFLLTQIRDYGIKKFAQRISNSYAHYYNKKNEQNGPLFENRFKAVRIINDEQLIHVSRYIHLNPLTAYLVDDASKFKFSSYNHYLGKEILSFVHNELVMSKFSSAESYKSFVNDQKDYQRKLDYIKNLILD